MLAAVLRHGEVLSGDAASRGVQGAVVVGGGLALLQAAHVGRDWQRLHHVQAVEALQAPQRLEVGVLGATGVAGATVLAARELVRERRVAVVGGVGARVGGVGGVVVVLVVGCVVVLVVVVAGVKVFSGSKIPA